MLYSTTQLQTFTVRAADNHEGKIKDIHFREDNWNVEDIVIDMGGWLLEHNITIKPANVKQVDADNKSIQIDIRKSDLGVESEVTPEAGPTAVDETGEYTDVYLHNTNEVAGYSIHTHDRELGHVDSFVVDTDSWTVRYFVIKMREWLPGKQVLLAREWISKISWEETRLYVDLDTSVLQSAPDYVPSQPVTREYEAQLYSHYGLTPYWHSQSG